MKTQLSSMYHKIGNAMNDPQVFAVTAAIALTAFSLYAPETFALNSADQVKELETLTQEVGKITKVACYVIGTASAGIGTLWAVAAQSLKVGVSSAAVTLLAFKSPAFFAQSMII